MGNAIAGRKIKGGTKMEDNIDLQAAIAGKEKYYEERKFLSKLKAVGLKLGFKALHTVAVLYCALKSPLMPTKDKLIIVGALGYLILPIDIMADFLPVFGLTDDVAVIMKAFMTVYGSITEDLKSEAHQLLKSMFGDQYQYEEEMLEM